MKTFVIFLQILTISTSVAVAQQAQPVNFSRQILPILSDKCFVCHGPDAHDKNLVRLDSFAGATVDRGGYFAIDSSSPVDSEILARIHSDEDPMPPRESSKQLTDQEKELLNRWIKQGGKYTTHWAFVPPARQPIENEQAWDAIDRFITAQLNEQGISFAESADRETLARRVALVLTGLPPEPEMLNRFLNDDQPDAYSRLVDELLASPRFGEHQARYWLDAVRYGDTHGLHLDNRRGIYPYRDWVVKAYNDNLPLDDFITWQLAGDLFPTRRWNNRSRPGSFGSIQARPKEGRFRKSFNAKTILIEPKPSVRFCWGCH